MGIPLRNRKKETKKRRKKGRKKERNFFPQKKFVDESQKHFAEQREQKNTHCLVPFSDFQEHANLIDDLRKQSRGGLWAGID